MQSSKVLFSRLLPELQLHEKPMRPVMPTSITQEMAKGFTHFMVKAFSESRKSTFPEML
jgi:hypothetical protein